MTLSRQLVLLILALVLALFLGTLAISVYNSRDYLESQLASHAQDTATSLGLSATSHFERGDRAMVTTMVNAMFHRGDYLSIRIDDLDGQVLVERTIPLTIDEVPAWFVRGFELAPPERTATMMSGWRQVGRVRVSSHPGLAYRQLWQTARQTLWLFLGIASLVLAVALLALRALLQPLKSVERQAAAICEREFPVVDDRPLTLEFRRVVEAMNRLSTRVSRMLSDAEETATRLRREAYQDPVTGLANRRQFMDVLEHRLAEPGLFETGGLMLLRINDLAAVNRQQGYPAGDRLLADVGRAIADTLEAGTLARLSGAEFAMLIEGGDTAHLRDRAAAVSDRVADLGARLALPSADVAHLGGAPFAGQTAAGLLADADLALREAQRSGANAWVVPSDPAAPAGIVGRRDWGELIERVLGEGGLSLVCQPVVACREGTLHHQEVFARLPDPDRPGSDLAAAVFMPMAEEAGLAGRVDRAVAERVLACMAGGDLRGRVAMNLAATSLDDDALLDWFADRLGRDGDTAARLVLELPEYGVTARLERLAAWVERLRSTGVGFALDHFGRGFASFAYLRRFPLCHLKVDGSYVRNLEDSGDNRFFLRTLSDIAHGLDMFVVAESIETEETWRQVCGLGLDAGRGVWLGAPESCGR